MSRREDTIPSAIRTMLRAVRNILLPFILLLHVQAEDFSTINGDKLTRFFDSFANRQEPVRVLMIGDSMANSWQSMSFWMMNQFLLKRPYAGSSLNNAYNRLLWTSTNGATVVPQSPLWFAYHFQVPQSSSIWWENGHDANGILSDRVGVYWVAQPQGGLIDLYLSNRGGEWTNALSLEGFSRDPRGCFTNLSLPRSEYRLMLQSRTGTNYIIGPELVDTTAKGIHMAWIDYSGIAMSDVLAVPHSIREPILGAFNADLLVWHFKEGAVNPGFLAAALAENEALYHRVLPEMDVVYFGTPWYAFDNQGIDTINENRVVRATAIQFDRGYLDCRTPAPSYEWLRDHNYMEDFIHPNYAGAEFLTRKAWNDVGFFALGADRRLSLRDTFGGSIFMSATLIPGIAYEFQSSTNLLDWTTFRSESGAKGPLEIQLAPADPTVQYRMRLLLQN